MSISGTREPKPLGSGSSGRGMFLLSFVSGIVAILVYIKVFTFAAEDDEYIYSPKSKNTSSWWGGNMRWQPISNDDNCLPGFQLANTTIHCGVGDLSPITRDSEGREYCGGVKMEPNACVLPESGRFIVVKEEEGSMSPLPHRFGISSSGTSPRCKTMESFANGTFDSTGEWFPESCGAIPLSPFAWTQNAACQTTISMLVSVPRISKELGFWCCPP